MSWNRVIRVLILFCLATFIGNIFISPADSKVTIDKVAEGTVKNIDMNNYVQKGNQDIKRNLSLDPADYESILYYKSIDDMKANEIVIVQFKSHEDQDSFKTAIQKHVANKIEVFKDYAPDQEDVLENYKCYIQANYALYVVDDNARLIVKQFKDALGG